MILSSIVIKPYPFRRFVSVLFALAALILAMHPIIASAADISITKGTGTITIPSYNADDTLIITGNALAASDWNTLKALTTNFKLRMENNQTEIPDSALYNCTTLTTLDLSGCTALNSIGKDAFRKCSLLTRVDLSGCSNLQSIGVGGFQQSTALANVNLSGCSKLTSIADSAFYQCAALKTADLSGCTALKSIGGNAFRKCSLLTRVDLSGCSSLQTIDVGAFQECTALADVNLSGCSKLISIADSAFYQCAALKTADLSGCTALQSIGDDVFRSCGALTELRLNRTPPPSLGTSIFLNSDNVKIYVPGNLVETYKSAWPNYADKIFAMPSAAAPTATPSGGSYNAPQTVVLECLTPGATIYYTLDGSNPRASSTRSTYTAPLTIPLGTTLKAYAAKDGMEDSDVLTQTYTQMGFVAEPTATPSGGSYNAPQTVVLECLTPGATIYYTLDGSNPRASSTRSTYTAPLTIPLGTTLKAYAAKDGMEDSDVLTQTYTQMGFAAAPTATPSGGSYNAPQTVVLECLTPGATIYYTLDGSNPRASSTRSTYTAPLTIPVGTTLKAYAAKDGMEDSDVLTQTYTQMGFVAVPTATPSGGSYNAPQTVVLECLTPGAAIYYTLDGSNPRASATKNRYTAPLTIPVGTTLKAYAAKDGMEDSEVLTQTYTRMGFVAAPTATPSGGSYNAPQTVVLECLTPGAAIYYTLDGSNPRDSSTRKIYIAPLTIPTGTTLKAYAVKNGMEDSEVQTQTYTQMQIHNSSGGCNSGIGFAILGLVIHLLAVLTKKRLNSEA